MCHFNYPDKYLENKNVLDKKYKIYQGEHNITCSSDLRRQVYVKITSNSLNNSLNKNFYFYCIIFLYLLSLNNFCLKFFYVPNIFLDIQEIFFNILVTFEYLAYNNLNGIVC